jgi:hypothetical protein
MSQILVLALSSIMQRQPIFVTRSSADVLGVLETMLAKYPKLLEGLQLSVIDR